ncbi:hypothetical protein HRR78_000039 [Exophiala dermatitidis]|nr:hypothetical protein HRR75_000946 [Exophiala dermatitidis]KAJ4559519.1 hypothetical protein HRR78_000039 [Exophiala dermatitidis]
MAGRGSASPSPAPEAPVAATPGPRAAALQKVFAGALSSSIKANSYANFSSCFPTPAKYCPTALEGVWRQLNARLEEECTRDFEKILEERRVVEGLNQWDGMIEEARRRKNRAVEGDVPDRPLHTLSAYELYTANLTPYLQQATQELEGKLQSTQDDNAKLMTTIEQQRAELEQLLNGLEMAIKDIEGAVQALPTADQGGVEGLRNHVWEIEQELSAHR